MTRAQKRMGASSLQNWWAGRAGKRQKCAAAACPPDGEGACNDTDPISLEAIADIQRAGRRLFLHHTHGVVHAYDAAHLCAYLEAADQAVAPLTRQPFSKADLRQLAAAAGRHPEYLIAVRKFGRWRAFMPSAMQAAASDIDCLWSYVELLVAIGGDAHAGKSLELCVILIFPWMFQCAQSIRAAHDAGTGPPLAGVLRMFEARLQGLKPGPFRSGCEAFLAQLAADPAKTRTTPDPQ